MPPKKGNYRNKLRKQQQDNGRVCRGSFSFFVGKHLEEYKVYSTKADARSVATRHGRGTAAFDLPHDEGFMAHYHRSDRTGAHYTWVDEVLKNKDTVVAISQDGRLKSTLACLFKKHKHAEFTPAVDFASLRIARTSSKERSNTDEERSHSDEERSNTDG